MEKQHPEGSQQGPVDQHGDPGYVCCSEKRFSLRVNLTIGKLCNRVVENESILMYE
jgi:hypothetical protein